MCGCDFPSSCGASKPHSGRETHSASAAKRRKGGNAAGEHRPAEALGLDLKEPTPNQTGASDSPLQDSVAYKRRGHNMLFCHVC
jgi:hypothetical protein